MSVSRLVLAPLLLFWPLLAAAADPPVGRLVHYSGVVQGVGFRATAEEIARDYPVTGWVKNLPDGRVELVVEGPEAAVKKFLQAVRRHWEKNIDKEQIEEKPATGKYAKFEAAY